MWECPNCGEMNDDDEFECQYCGYGSAPRRPPAYYYEDDDDDCFWGEEYCEDGIPDVNQGWVGENYG